jgi:methyltransferase-like protein/protein-L-isoaspartate O-methyltransferase
MSSTPNSYDSVPYPGLAFSQTHPDRLAVMATILGMSPVPVDRCRVLEIACGRGGNLIPMAYGLPSTEFVGIDLTANPVKFAQERIRRLGLKNIRIERMDLMEIGPDVGQFDYIIAHGVYAWVPATVQAKILSICKANLSANGVAFVSYNTQPAGHVREILREMVRFHERNAGRAANPVKAGRDFLEAILNATDGRSPWKALFQDELKVTFNREESVVYHDDLNESFLPVSFGDFAQRAADRGLQFLSEAFLNDLLEPELGEGVFESLRHIAAGDLIALQQYTDYARYRRFRQSLLCHAEVRLQRGGVLGRVRNLLVASPMRAGAEKAGGTLEFTNSRGAGTLTTNNPAIIAILRRLEQIWPHAERFEELAAAILPSIRPGQPAEEVEGLAQAILKLAASMLADLRTCDVRMATGVSEKPAASLLARLMVQEGGLVTTLLHSHVTIEDEQGRKFLQLLDGTHDRQALEDAMVAGSQNDSGKTVLQQVDWNLENFYRLGLLVA